MTREEWNQVLATESATSNQRGAIMREFARLGFDDLDRDKRLAVCAGLLGLDELDSTGDLTMGQAGQLIRVLTACADQSELPRPSRPQPSPIAGWAFALGAASRSWNALLLGPDTGERCGETPMAL